MFPLSNWTELDIWRYIELEDLELPSIYFAHEREVFERDGILLATSEYTQPADGETAKTEWVRHRDKRIRRDAAPSAAPVGDRRIGRRR